MRAVCCIGVAHNYFAKRKYNLVELVRPEQEASDAKAEVGAKEENSETPEDVKGGTSEIEENTVEEDTDVKSVPNINVNGSCEVDEVDKSKEVESC